MQTTPDGLAQVASDATRGVVVEPTAGRPVAESERVCTGRVVDAQHEPVPTARVLVAPEGRTQGTPLENLDPSRIAWAQRAEALTDSAGLFRVVGVTAARARIAIRKSGYAPHDTVVDLARARVDIGDIVLEPGVMLRGRVVDRAGLPVSGARLRRLSSSAGPAVILGAVFDDVVATTDAEGRFAADEIAVGPWTLMIKAAGHTDRIERGTTRSPGESVDGLEFVVEATTSIAGRVVGADALALRELWIAAVPKGDRSSGPLPAGELVDEKRFLILPKSARCNPDGSFSLFDLAPDLTYRLVGRVGKQDAFARVATNWRDVRAGERGVELLFEPETALVFQVVDAATSLPVSEMEVRVGNRLMIPFTDDSGAVRRAFPDGRVRFESVLRAQLEEGAELVIEARGYSTLKVGRLKRVAGRDLDLGVLRLERASLVRVLVFDAATREPVAGAHVALERSEPRPFLPTETTSTAPVREASADPLFLHAGDTDESGRVVLNRIPGASVVVAVLHAGYTPYRSDALALAPAGDTEQTIELKRGGSVVVSVTDVRGSPLAGVRVDHRERRAAQSSGASRADFPATTDAEGKIRFEHLEAGSHHFEAGTATPVESARSAEVEVVEGGEHTLTLVLPERARVTGRVTEGGAVLSGATLHFESAVGLVVDARGTIRSLSARTNGNGEYALSDVDLGAYRVRVTHPERAMSFAIDVVIAAKKSTVDLDLPRTTIEGTLVDEDGHPVLGAEVRALPVLDSASVESANSTFVPSAADGKFVLRGVQPDVDLVVHVRGGDYQPIQSDVVRVARGETKLGIDLRLKAGAALEVSVTTGDGRPAAHRPVQATYTGLVKIAATNVLATTNAAGRALFRGLEPGPWRLRVENANDPSASAEVLFEVERGVANTAKIEVR
ncbi:MAG: carboxypeptidase-like regulatory domain-containing protein [Planctomycetota bacterium]|nr:carboxypeptidase-like regulatory domain-containing protein [Planctomycetota bacterium]